MTTGEDMVVLALHHQGKSFGALAQALDEPEPELRAAISCEVLPVELVRRLAKALELPEAYFYGGYKYVGGKLVEVK